MKKKYRVLYNLNHKTAMPFEVDLLKMLGFEVFVPNVIPTDSVAMRSAAEKSSEMDIGLTIDAEVLKFLNEIDFYKPLSKKIMAVVNDNFDVVFSIADPKIIDAYLNNFNGVVLLRAYGNANEFSYSRYFSDVIGECHLDSVRKAGKRFKFAEIFDNIHKVESKEYKKAALWLPLGLPNKYLTDRNIWKGGGEEVIFLAPDILHLPYYYESYKKFRAEFKNYSYRVIGQQRIKPDDENVLGFVSSDGFKELMQKAPAYLYTSNEERHLHYTPVEAMVLGLPTLFDKRGALSQLFSKTAPGAYRSIDEAHQKLDRLISGDVKLIKAIQASQNEVVEKMTIEWCFVQWKKAFESEIYPVLETINDQRNNGVCSTLLNDSMVPTEALSYTWLHSFDFLPHLKVQGRASLERIAEQSEALLGNYEFLGKKVLEIGEGEGAYAVQIVRKGAEKLTTLCINREQFEKCSIVKDALILPAWDLRVVGIPDLASYVSNQTEIYDVVLIHGVLNHCEDIVNIVRSISRVVRDLIVIEYWQGGLPIDGESTIAFTSNDQRALGYPLIKFNNGVITEIIRDNFPIATEFKATPNEAFRYILRVNKNKKIINQDVEIKHNKKNNGIFNRVRDLVAN